MPAKNAGEYIAECIYSVLNQRFSNWELIVVNDHSSDNTKMLLEDFANGDDRIKCFDNPGNGIIPALQLGYQKAQGTFITRMDADDIMTGDKLEVLVNSLIKSGPGHLSTGLVRYFVNYGEVGDGYVKYQDWLNGLSRMGNNFKQIYKECVIPSPCWMMHRVDFERIGGFDAEVYPEDYDLCFRMYGDKIKVNPIDRILHFWRDYPARTSRNDENYKDNRFLDLKLHYFFKIDHDPRKTLVIWGAGHKGKTIAKYCAEHDIRFEWVCNNPRKIGQKIYDKILKADDSFRLSSESHQLILTVANPVDQKKIMARVELYDLIESRDFYRFC